MQSIDGFVNEAPKNTPDDWVPIKIMAFVYDPDSEGVVGVFYYKHSGLVMSSPVSSLILKVKTDD